MDDAAQSQLFTLLIIAALVVLYHWRRRWRGSGTSHGQASWATSRQMEEAGLFRGTGLILGRTSVGRRLVTLGTFCHLLLVGGSGSGKGVSIILPALLWYFRGSCCCFDTKGDLFAQSAGYRQRRGHRIIDLAPFAGGKDRWNILDAIRPGPMLVDHARAIAEMLVVRLGSEPDPHWGESGVMVICGILVFVLVRLEGPDRNLNAVREITADPALLEAAAQKLIEMGGIPARMGHHIQGMQDKEKSGVMSTVARHLAFLDSELVSAAVASSTFDAASDLCRPGTTLYIRIPPDQLEAQRGLLRCWLGMLIRLIGAAGSESSEVLFLIDEASALGSSLPAVEEALVRGRSAGVRLLLAYQSDSQVRAAFKEKPTLIYDNTDAQIYLAPNGYEMAERLSKMLGDQTIVVESAGENESTSRQTSGQGESGQTSTSWSRNWSEIGRALARPEELLTMSPDFLLVFLRGMNPMALRRVKWYADPLFGAASLSPPPLWWLLLFACLGLMGWALWRAGNF
jgi:type IV secretion system protein VirD4